MVLEEPCNISFFINIHPVRRRHLGQSRHSHNITRLADNKACAGTYTHIFDRYIKVVRCAYKVGVVRQRILRLSDTYGHLIQPESLEFLHLFLSLPFKDHAFTAVNTSHYFSQFFGNRFIYVI